MSTITATGHSLGGAVATLSAFDVAQHLEQNWDRWKKEDWKTRECPKVRLVTYGSPRLGNATFVDTFHRLGVAALRIENLGDVVPNVPSLWAAAPMQGRSTEVSDATQLCSLAATATDGNRRVSCILLLNPTLLPLLPLPMLLLLLLLGRGGGQGGGCR